MLRRCLLAVPLLWLGSVGPAWGQELRFQARMTGGITVTGNSLGLSKAQNENGPGTLDSIGTFMSLSGASVDNAPLVVSNPWPSGTTADWMQNGSNAVLELPSDAQMLYAELVWGGSTNYVEDVTASLDTAVTLSRPGASTSVTPDAATAVTIAQQSGAGFAVSYYLRSAEVTAFVRTHGAGVYAVSGVPATQHETINSLNAAGWSLIVAYWSQALAARDLRVQVGGTYVDEDSIQDYAFSNLCPPPTGAVRGRLMASALDGDANQTGDQLLFGETNVALLPLAGPNNPETNFFASQLNGDDGLVDTRGSFGSVNHDAALGTNVKGGRQGWDLTSLSLSSVDAQLVSGQTHAVVRAATVGDSFLPVAVALEVDANAPKFLAGDHTSYGPNVVEQGETFAITTSLDNSGLVPADLILIMPLEAGVTLVSYTTDDVTGDAAGQPVTTPDLATGVDGGTLGVGEQRVIHLTLQATGEPASGDSYLFQPHWEYRYSACYGSTAADVWPLPTFEITLDSSGSGGAGGASGDAGGAGANDPGAAGDNTGGAPERGAGGAPSEPPGGSAADPSAGESAGGDATDTGDANRTSSGCACRTPVAPGRSNSAVIAALLALGALARRGSKRRQLDAR